MKGKGEVDMVLKGEKELNEREGGDRYGIERRIGTEWKGREDRYGIERRIGTEWKGRGEVDMVLKGEKGLNEREGGIDMVLKGEKELFEKGINLKIISSEDNIIRFIFWDF